MSVVGVLALQGGFEAHAVALRELGHDVRYVRAKEDFDGLDGLVLPGGESTVHLKLVDRFDLAGALVAHHRAGKPVLATCAGLILIAKHVARPEQRSFGFVDVDVERNGFGRQLDSFEGTSDGGEHALVFIRAPRIVRVGDGVRVLATLRGEPVLVREGNVVAATFHPELTADRSIHALAFGAGRVRAPSEVVVNARACVSP